MYAPNQSGHTVGEPSAGLKRSAGLLLQKVGRIRVCLEGKVMLLCFLFWLKHTVLKRSSTSFRATGEGRSAGDILGVKVIYIWLDSTNEEYNIPGE